MTRPHGSAGSARGGWRGRGRGPARVEVRSRIALIAALAVALAVVLVAVSAYVAVRGELVGGIDQSLSRTAGKLEKLRAEQGLAGALAVVFRPTTAISSGEVSQVVGAGGIVIARSRGAGELPVAPATLRIVAGGSGPVVAQASIATTPVRLLVTEFGRGLALEVAAPVAGIDADLSRLALVLAIAAALGVVVALGLGAAVAGLALRPVRRLAGAAEAVAATQDLSQRIPLEGRDELSRLAASINELLGALERSQAAQRQLVADASHELRTPLSSLRTNVELLASDAPIDRATRAQVSADVRRQFDRIARLVGELIDLARFDRAEGADRAVAALDLDEVVVGVCEDLAANYPGVSIVPVLDPVRVRASRGDLERLVANLVDNAAKWSPPAGRIEVRLVAGPPVRLTVSDEGPGIGEDALPHVFDRFYRGSGAGAVPGSGLGLAIVRRIAEVHGGSVAIESALGAGTRVELVLPPLEAGPPTRGAKGARRGG